ncbi:MAG TPA: NlpC/P60 family protein [Streptosporangiaceae bacterium]|nr:NlpC/P60 family protein [Streptosporangiaceae bacterium]
MVTRQAGSKARLRRGVAVVAGLLSIGSLTVVAVNAGAAPKPTVAEVQAKINQLTTEFNKVSEQLDQVDERLKSARGQLKTVTIRWKQAYSQFKSAQTSMAQIAASAYEDTGATSIAGVLTTDDPSVVLRQGSLLLELSTQRDAQTQQLLLSANQLSGVKQEMQRTEDGVAQLQQQLNSHKNALKNLISNEQATLDSLTSQQQQQVTTTTIGKGGQGTVTPQAPPATIPTGTQAYAAVAFVFKQLGCPYVYAAAGPCAVGYDCSGLVSAAWKSAGVDIPRDTYSQWAALPHVPESQLQPGDLLYYNGISHVAMYVGNGMFIDAPIPGEHVEELPMNSAWYQSNLDGVARP